jgi:uncharacterized membrane protein
MLQRVVTYFFRGLLTLVPIIATGYAAYFLFVTVDDWVNLEGLLNRRIPGAGVALTIVFITVAGMLASSIWTRWLFRLTDRAFRRLPLVKLLYSSLTDLVGAFVGEKKRFDRPVLVRPVPDADFALVGFETRDSLAAFDLADHAAVYVPQAYNFGGTVLLVPRSRVTPLAIDGVTAMTFALSGGVSGQLPGRRTEQIQDPTIS